MGHKIHDVWTDERIEMATKLRADGLSAARIAKALGCFENYPDKGRNAVTGKLIRLRVGTSTTRPDSVSASKRSRKGLVKAKKSVAQARQRSSPLQSVLTEARSYESSTEELVIPLKERRTILIRKNGKLEANGQFTADNCHWPIGDPQAKDFHFCGKKIVQEAQKKPSSYCEFHRRRAYAPPVPRRRAA